jgi:flagellar motor switch protein FliN
MTEDDTDSDENSEAEVESSEDDKDVSDLDEVEESAAAASIENEIDDDDDDWSDLVEAKEPDQEAVYDIPVRVSTVLGKSTMQVHEILKLGRGAVVKLDRKVGEAVDIYVNDRLVARGEIVMVGDRLGITMTEIIKTQKG